MQSICKYALEYFSTFGINRAKKFDNTQDITYNQDEK